jgi:hypothetical protein
MAEDRANDARRVPNSAAPTLWQEGVELHTDKEFYEPHRHTSVEDFDTTEKDLHKEESKAFDRGEIKSANERLDSGDIPSAYRKK